MSAAVLLRAFFFFLLLDSFESAEKRMNNVCRTFNDYYNINESSNCFYDAAAEYELPYLVTTAGYPLETYRLITKDGYILTLFRLPNDRSRNPNGKLNPVFIQHGIWSNSANFVTLGNDSLVYVLWDAGYDVWIGNFRGTYYSQEHVNLTVLHKKYWDHSIDEMATIDMPLVLDFIARKTERRGEIFYIGHSLGTTIGLMYAAEFPEEAASHVQLFVFMAPAYTLSNMISPFRKIVPFLPKILKLANEFDLVRLISQSQPARSIVQVLCLESPVLMRLCGQFHNLFYGPITGVGTEKIPVYFNIVPGGTALKVLVHAGDLINNNFRKYDYGLDNLAKYGALTPPIYDITRIKTPCQVIYGIDDWVAGKKDAINLFNTLSPEARFGIREINEHHFNHIDFVYGRWTRRLVYDRIVNTFNNFPNKT